ncbi:hypothetical protein [Inquilinus sp.]|uniref:hypothetical protein n=1 Tax=Inquilinus sp. TaxID=1932117 RepID=UPI0031DDA024
MAVTQGDRSHRVFLAMAAEVGETAESEVEDARLCHEIRDYLERSEVAERVESCPAPAMVAELCRRYGLPEDMEEWLAIADAALEELGFLAPADDPPEDLPGPRSAPGRRPRPPDTG